MSAPTFRDLEHKGWTARADTYRDAVGRITEQAIGAILDSFGELAGRRLLDVACGTGELAGEAARRGAQVSAVDFSAAMLEAAARAHPRVEFEEADAANLPYRDAAFDAVACAFGLLHFERAEAAIGEARRVLRHGGRYTFCVWQPPDQRGGFFELVLGALQRHANLDVGLPAAPPFFRFADPKECRNVLTAAGFAEPTSRVIELPCRLAQAHDVLDMIRRGAVRTSMVLDAQSEAARQAIEDAIVAGAEAYRNEGGIELRMPAVVTSAQAV